MDRSKQQLLYNQIIRYKKCIDERYKREIRNFIYEMLHQQMLRWVGAALTKLKWRDERDNIISWSWDCFIFCLDSFDHKKKIDVVRHFNTYTVYYLKIQRSKINKEDKQQGGRGFTNIIRISENDIDFLKHSLDIRATNKTGADIMNELHDIGHFRSKLNEKHKIIFDDALMSLSPERKFYSLRQKESGIPYGRYQEAKNIFKHVIKFFLGTTTF